MGNDNIPNSLGRREVLQTMGVGGAILWGGVHTSAGKSPPEDVNQDVISGEELYELSSVAYKAEDVRNILPDNFPKSNIEFVDVTTNEPSSELDHNQVRVSGAREVGNNIANRTRLALSSSDELVVQYTGFDRRSERDIQSRARLFQINGSEFSESTLELINTSINGGFPKGTSSFEQSTTCPGCDTGGGPGSSGYYLDETQTCTSVSVDCVLNYCSLCSWCGTPPTCLTCLVGVCGFAIPFCCTNWNVTEECIACGGTP